MGKPDLAGGMTSIAFRAADVEVVVSYDQETDTQRTDNETFEVGEPVEFDVLSVFHGKEGDLISVQFPNGDCAYFLPADLFSLSPQ